MGLRIATNIASQEVQKNLSKVTGRGQESLAKLSSGLRINKAVDDAAGLAISQRLRATSRSLAQATRNANNGISYVQTAEGALNESSNIMIRLRELSIQAASDTVGDNERELLNFEYQQLLEEVNRIADSSEFNGLKLINGEGNGVLSFHIGAGSGEENKIEYDSDKTNATPLALGIHGLDVLERGSAENGLEQLDGAINKISGFRARLGSIQSRLRSTVNNLQVQRINQDEAKSVIEDTDIAEETSKLVRSNVTTQAGVASLVSANALPNIALRLLE